MSQQKEAIDLMNVEYDDVLNLYRGWKKSEGALRDKNKELATLKGRIAQLQESHNKFRNQIHALESVKELTVTLQNKLSILEQENKQLATENRELAELNLQAEDILKEKSSSEEVHSNTLRDVQLEFANLRGRYEETIKAQQELEKLAADEQAMRLSAESRLLSSNESIDQLREENRVLSQKLESAVLRMNQCDHELAHASEQLSSLSKELSSVKTNQTKMSTLEAENGLLKGDISRLIRLLEKSPETSGFIASWQDSGGLDFIGIDRNISGVNRTDQSHNHLEHSDTVWQSIANGSKYGASESNLGDLTPGEFAHLRRIHGEDPFPMTANLSEEAEYWVPSDAAKLGMNFLANKLPHAPPKVIMDFLRSMNKIWLRRERRKLKKVKSVFSGQIADLRRQLANAKPYKGVMAERTVRRLKSQIREDRGKMLKGRPRKSLEETQREMYEFDEEDQGDPFDHYYSAPYQHNHELTGVKRICRVEKSKSKVKSKVSEVSQEKLLEASLISLENVGREIQKSSNSLRDSFKDRSIADQGGVDASYQDSGDLRHPNSSYLRGALWFGRNLTMITEDLADAITEFRGKHLSEITNASKDTDYRRASYRLNLLAASGINESLALVNKSRQHVRELLQGASTLAPGDTTKYNIFLRKLPIESSLTKSRDHIQLEDSGGHSYSSSNASRIQYFDSSN